MSANTPLRPEPLTPEAFAPFGAVIWADPARAIEINDGYATRFHDLVRPALEGGNATLSIFRGRPRPPLLEMLERHPFGSQAFVPLGGRDWLAAVAEEPEPAAVRLFRCAGDQGVQYAPGVWHHPLLVIGPPQDFLVVDRTSPETNLETAALREPVAFRP